MHVQIWRERAEGHTVAVATWEGRVVVAALVCSDEEAGYYMVNGIGEANDPELAEFIDGQQDGFDFVMKGV